MKKTLLACALFLAYSITHADNTGPTPSAALPPTSATTDTAAMPATLDSKTMDCNAHFPGNLKLSPEVVKLWAEKAIMQSFDYNSENINIKLQALKICFTDTGWTSYNAALQQSGNLAAIQKQKLTVSSQLDGNPDISVIKENQWKVTMPVQVVYQNQQDKITQQLNIDALITRKVSGDLGIQQIIASSKKSS